MVDTANLADATPYSISTVKPLNREQSLIRPSYGDPLSSARSWLVGSVCKHLWTEFCFVDFPPLGRRTISRVRWSCLPWPPSWVCFSINLLTKVTLTCRRSGMECCDRTMVYCFSTMRPSRSRSVNKGTLPTREWQCPSIINQNVSAHY